MGKSSKSKKKWTPPNAWAPVHVTPEVVFNPKYRGYSVMEFKTKITAQAVSEYSNMLKERSDSIGSAGLLKTIYHLIHRFDKAIHKKPGYDIDYANLDCIDYRQYKGESDPAVKEELEKITDMDSEILQLIYPIFDEGVIYGICNDEILYFKVLEFEKNRVKIHIRQLGVYDDEVISAHDANDYYRKHDCRHFLPELEADFVFDISEINKVVGLAPSYSNVRSTYDILSSVSPKELNVNRLEYDIWRKLNLKVSMESEVFADPSARSAYNFPPMKVDNYQRIGMAYIKYMMLANYYLNREKQAKREGGKKKKTIINESTNPIDAENKTSDKNIKIIGNVKICYSDDSKDVIERRKYTFHKQAWERRGYYRKLKSGKIVKVKPCICKRKGIDPDHISMDKSQNIIKVV